MTIYSFRVSGDTLFIDESLLSYFNVNYMQVKKAIGVLYKIRQDEVILAIHSEDIAGLVQISMFS